MKQIMLLATLVAWPSQVMAWNWCGADMHPPVAFAGEPSVQYEVAAFPPEWLPEICGTSYPVGSLGGCVEEVEGFFFMSIRNDVSLTERACIIWHEKAHINGWRHGLFRAITADRLAVLVTSYTPISVPYSTHGK